MKKIVAYFAENSLIVNLVTFAVLIFGLFFLFQTNKEAFPNIDFDWVLVETLYPGATAADVEKHITIPLEDQLREVTGIEQISSSSIEARSVIAVKLDPDLDNKDKTISDIENAIDRENDLPDDAEDPIVRELSTQQQPVLSVSIYSKNGIKNDKDEFALRKYAKIIEDNLKDIEGVALIDKRGYRDREMLVEVDPKKLELYHVAINDIVLALSNKNLNFPGGVARKNNEEILIRTIGEVETSKDISNVLIRANDIGEWVKVGDVARVKDSFETQTIINKVIGYQAVTLTILKKESYDIIELVDRINSELEKTKKIIPKDYEIVTNDDLSYYVRRRLNVLTNNGIAGLILVVFSLLLALGWRISLVTAIGLPLAFAGTFIWMGTYGLSINLISMFGLIIVLGMLVDDAIIVAENIYRHLEEGYPLKKAVIEGTHEVIVPVAGTIMTTIAAFGPLMFMEGIMGKFMWMLPAVVSVALIMSWIESMFILPSHVYDIEKIFNRKRAESGKKEGKVSPLKLRIRYVKMLGFVLRHKYTFAFGMFIALILSLILAATQMKFILFPASGIETFIVKAEAPLGTTVEEMSTKLTDIEKIVAKLPKDELDDFIAQAGCIAENPNDPEKKQGSHYGMIIVHLTPMQGRERKADEIVDDLRKKAEPFKKQFRKLEFTMIQSGPPTGLPVSVTIKGEEIATLKEISKKYKTFLATIKGLKDIKDNFEDRKKELKIFVKPEVAARTGVTVYDVASTVRSCYEGTVATEIKKSDEEIDIRVMLPEKLRYDGLNSLYQIKVSNKNGGLIPLKNIATFEEDTGISLIIRKDWRRNITVTAEIDEKAKDVTSVAVNTKLKEKFATISEDYPGYVVDYEGEFKDTQESMEQLFYSFILAGIIIYIILVAIFKTLHHPLIVMSIIPYSIIGVIWSFYLHDLLLLDLPFSFLAIMGVVGLIGVIVNDSIVFVDFINNARKCGLSPFEASLEAGRKRLRPILLTSVTTVLGLMPTAYGIGGLDPFLIPMAISLSWGLAFGTVITLFMTPAIYNIFYSLRHHIFKKSPFQQGQKSIIDNIPMPPSS
jgi:multidrug efflux pump subunit AcrB